MDILLLLFVLYVAVLYMLFLGQIRPHLKTPIIVASVARSVVTLLGLTIITLPDSTADAQYFQQLALFRSEQGFTEILSSINFNSYFYPDLVALLYSLLIPNVVLMHGMNLLAGISIVYWVGVLAEDLWGVSAAQKAAWVAALFPTLVLNSAVTLREPLLAFSILLSCIGFLRWRSTGSLYWGGGAIAFAALSMMLHGAHAIDLGWLLILMLFFSLRAMSFRTKRSKFILTLILSSGVIGLILINAQAITIPKIGSLESIDVELVIARSSRAMRGNASYPVWLSVQSLTDYSWKWIVRVPYFLFSPFPWDVRSTTHLLGLLDGILYLTMFVFALRSHGYIRSNSAAIAVIILFLPSIWVYSMSVGNFGTGIRHRSKFVPIFIALTVGSWVKYREHRHLYQPLNFARARRLHFSPGSRRGYKAL